MGNSISSNTQGLPHELLSIRQSISHTSPSDPTSVGSRSISGTNAGGPEQEDKLAQVFQKLMALLAQEVKKPDGNGNVAPKSSDFPNTVTAKPTDTANRILQSFISNSTPSTIQSPDMTGVSPSIRNAGSGLNSTIITNTSDHDEKIGQFLNSGSTSQPEA